MTIFQDFKDALRLSDHYLSLQQISITSLFNRLGHNISRQKEEITKMLFGEPLYTIPEAAIATRLSRWTIWDLLKKGVILRSKIAGRTVIRESELRKLLVDKPKEKRTA
jgi:hypothetical protein